MYKVIFYSTYKLLLKLKNHDPERAEDSGVTMVILALFFQIFFLFTLFDLLEENFVRTAIWNLNNGVKPNKLYSAPLVILFMVLVYRRYNSSRRQKIIADYDSRNYIVNWKRYLLILVIIITPLLVGIQILNAN